MAAPPTTPNWCAVARRRRVLDGRGALPALGFRIFADRLADLMALADQPATVRQIVTRLLKRFERAGWLAIGCERVQILNAPALRGLASGQAADNALAGQQLQQHPSG